MREELNPHVRQKESDQCGMVEQAAVHLPSFGPVLDVMCN